MRYLHYILIARFFFLTFFLYLPIIPALADSLGNYDIDSPKDKTIIVSVDAGVRTSARNSGYKATYPNVQMAVNSAAEGDTVFICSGRYPIFEMDGINFF